MTQLNTIDKTLFQLDEITEYEELPYLHNMMDLMIEDDETFCLADGTISHNSAISGFLSARQPDIHGAYALRGKVVNINGLKKEEIAHNTEYAELMGILGLNLYDSNVNEDPDELFEITLDDIKYIVAKNDIVIHNDKEYKVSEFL